MKSSAPSKRVILLAAVLAGWSGLAYAQDNLDRTMEQYKCRDVMRESGSGRDVAIAFLHGYLLGKSNSQNFNLDALHKQTESFIEHCLSNPDGRAVDSMIAVKK